MSILDQFRAGGTEPTTPAERIPVIGDVLAASRRPVATLAPTTRAVAWATTASTLLGAVAEYLLTPLAIVARGVEEGPAALSSDILLWPAPWLQPGIVALAGAVLLILAISSNGFSRVTSGQSIALAITAVVGGVALLPGLFVLLGWVLVIALGVALAGAIVVALISMLVE
jgi:hypothetical protein